MCYSPIYSYQFYKPTDRCSKIIHSYSFECPIITNTALYVSHKPTDCRNGLIYHFDRPSNPVNSLVYHFCRSADPIKNLKYRYCRC